jgi:putative transposase
VAHPDDDDSLLAKLKELAERHPRYGYRRISALVRREERANQKRIRRLWRKHRLQVQRVRRQRSSRKPPAARLVAAY